MENDAYAFLDRQPPLQSTLYAFHVIGIDRKREIEINGAVVLLTLGNI